jgi:hypothetical protein
MHYVNCYMCDAYYSQDGNPFYIADDGLMACVNCGSEQMDLKKEICDSNVIYTLTADNFSEMLVEHAYDVECDLKRHGILFTVCQLKETSTVFTISEEQVTLAMLAGVDIEDLFYFI